MRVVIVTSHPVQYTVPLFRRLAQRSVIRPVVLYQSVLGTNLSAMRVSAFDQILVWDVDVLSGYTKAFLARSRRATPDRRRSMVDASIVPYLVRGKFDAMVLVGWAYPTNWIAAAVARISKLPYLLYTDTDVRDHGASSHVHLRRAAIAVLLRGAAGALYTGTFNRDFYIRRGMSPERLWFAPWSVDNARFATGDRLRTRAQLRLRDDIVYALFVGTLIERKRPLALLQALADLQSSGRRVGALIVGTGPLDSVLRDYATRLSHVHMMGFVNQRELPHVYAAADVLVLPTARDPRATVVNEAMAAGLPVVITRGTGVWGHGDLIRDGREGFVTEVDDVSGLARAIARVLDPAVRTAAGNLARQRLDDWNYDTAASGWEQALTAVCGR